MCRVRPVPALIVGTPAVAFVTYALSSLNGSPVPEPPDWRSMLSYPTGSPYSYVLMVWIIYFLAVAITARRN